MMYMGAPVDPIRITSALEVVETFARIVDRNSLK